MKAEITGQIKIIGELQTFASGFNKSQLVVTSDEQYPSDIPIDFLKDKSDYLQNFKVGDKVVVSVNIKGSEYNGKYYVGLNAWKIQPAKSEGEPETHHANHPTNMPSPNQAKPMPFNSFVDEPKAFKEEEHDDLPF